MFTKLPNELLKDRNISDFDKLLYAVILSFQDRVCYATNEYLADLLGRDISTISKHLTKLETKHYIKRERKPKKYGGKERIIKPLKYLDNKRIGRSKHANQHIDNGIKDYAKTDISQFECDKTPIPYNNRLLNHNKESSLLTIPESVVVQMKELYPNKDIEKATEGFLAFYKGKTINTDFLLHKYREWCERERPSINDDTLAKLRAEYE